MTQLNKFLALSVLMTAINVPLYFYSKTLGGQHASNHPTAEDHAGDATPASADHGQSPHNAQPLPEPLFKEAASLDESPDEKTERFKSLAELYKPPLFGKCKKLFERYNRKQFPDKPHKAFVYSFDGETAYCADAYTEKGQLEAEEIVLRDCEEHHAGSGKYSPCRIYASQ